MIEILKYKQVNENKKIGYVDIKMGKLIYRKIPHMQSGSRKWFNFPTFGQEQEDGTIKYLPLWEFETAIHNGEFLEMLEDAVKKYCAANNIVGPDPLIIDEGMPF